MPLTRFSLRQFEAFTAIAELHSFSAAGDRLGMTSSGVSQLVAELESILGFRLFDRTTRRVTLSSAGRDFLAPAASVLHNAHAAEMAASDVRQRAAGIVRIGASQVLAATAIPAAIKDYQIHRPKVIIRVHDIAVDSLVDSVANADMDLTVGPDRATPSSVACEIAFDSRWVLWCAPSHPLAALKTINWKRLRDVSLVAAGRDHERSVAQMLLNAPPDARITPVHVVTSVTTALGIASHGLAATLTPAYVSVLACHFGLVMRRVVDPETVRHVCIYRSTLRAVSPAAEGFAEFLLDWLKNWKPETNGLPLR
ncbi:MAG: LysR family transcriptional regulator [Devosia sp.]